MFHPFYSPKIFDNKMVEVAGWGLLDFGGVQATTLKKTAMQVLAANDNRCSWSNKYPGQMCTLTRGTDTCQKDSGGGLYYTVRNRRYVVGIVSHGDACGVNKPSMNTRITSYIKWISDNTGLPWYCDFGDARFASPVKSFQSKADETSDACPSDEFPIDEEDVEEDQ